MASLYLETRHTLPEEDMMHPCLILLVIAFFSLGPLHSAYGQAEYDMRLITNQEGLPDRTVLFVTQDDQGLMWFITTYGLSSYNGYEYTHYGMPGTAPNFLSRIAFDLTGRPYIIENSTSIYRLINHQFEPVQLDTASTIRSVRDLAFDSAGHAWVVSREGFTLGVFDSNWTLIQEIETWTESQRIPFNARYKIYLRTNISGSRIYVHTQSSEVTCFDTDRKVLAHYTLFDSLVLCPYVFNFFPDEEGNVHMICPQGTVASVNPDGKIFQKYSDLKYRAGDYPMYIDRSGQKLYFGQYSYGLGQFDLQTGELKSLTLETAGYPAVAQTYSIAESNTGNIWVGGELGITIVSEYVPLFQKFDIDGQPDGALPGMGIRTILQTPGGLLFSTDHFPFNLLDPDNNTLTGLSDDSRVRVSFPSFFHALTQRDSIIYTVNGISLNVNSNEIKVTGDYSSEQIIEFDSRGRYYTLQPSGLIVYDKPYGSVLDRIPKIVDGLNLVPDQNGNIWACTNDGLFQYKFGKGIIRSVSNTSTPEDGTSPAFIQGLRSDIVNDIAFTANGSIWVATTSGLHSLDTVQNTIQFYGNLDLPSQVIYSILPEGDSALWLGTGNGLVRFDIATHDIMSFSTTDGIPHNEFNRRAKLAADDGWYYMGGIDGICRFRPEEITTLNKQKGAHLMLEGITVFNGDRTLGLDADSVMRTGYAVLQPDDDILTISVALSDFLEPERSEYRFRLEGMDPNFNNWNTQRSITYRNLPAGEYTFVAQARGANRINAENEVRIPVIVKEAFYNTIWFPLLLVLASSALIYVIARYRFLQKLKMEQLRTRIASDLHDEVGGVLSGIAMQMDLLESDVPEPLRHRMERVSSSSREAASKMRDVIWSVDASRDTFEDLLERMKAHVNEILPPAGITWKFDVDNSIDPELKVRSVVRQNIYLIFKEAVTNIARHSRATLVEVRITPYRTAGLALEVKDDGAGFDPDAIELGDGIRNMRRRAEILGAQLKLNVTGGVAWSLEVSRL